MKKILLISNITLLIFTWSCNKKVNENYVKNIEAQNIDTSKYEDKIYMKKLLDKAILKGDTTSYKEAYKNFVISNHHKEFLYYSIKMSEKYNYGDAYYHTYHLINLVDNINGYYSGADKAGLYNLLKAYELGNHSAKSKVNELFTEKNKKIPISLSILNEK